MLTMLTILSLLLALLVAAAWGRSYWRWDRIIVMSRDGRSFRWRGALTRGKLFLSIFSTDTPGLWDYHGSRALGIRFIARRDAPALAHTFIGFGWEQGREQDWW